ncbi:hypothetical protein CPB84DRAFT_961667 [Gymnopilus junonius]|uniref:F-box domain-containing protein n=1 Tax=Gymnopilus junonius TaxID=109634 RepID=A0A9P5NRI6_GYMJU|nr:hypothetical protein CPB84DRAFT_961667 [Gymnopilus junonius]
MASENGGARLPLELLEEIIDILAFDLFDPECRATLFECTLVCKTFYSRASGHLISDIHIGRISKTSQTIDDHVKLCKELEGLHNVLEMHPDLAPRVKALTIETCFGGVAPAKNRELLLENRHIPLIFPKLFSIVKFAWMNRAMVFPWSSFSTSVLEAFDILMTHLPYPF